MLKSSLFFCASFPLFSINTLFHGSLFWVTGAPALFLPKDNHLRKKVDRLNIRLAESWININNQLINTLLPKIHWQIDLPKEISTNKSYLLICNHQSWVDTMVVQYVGLGKFPFTRFFTKYELIYLPLVGQAFKILGFPMMKRHSKQAIANNPALRQEDLFEAKKSCANMQNNPFTLLNFLEGTRFTPLKKEQQQSPYKHLLKPKYGGLALATMMLADDIDGILDMTISYPDGIPQYMDIWKGKLTKITVKTELIALPEWINSADYYEDEAYKHQFKQWVDTLWQRKERILSDSH